MNNNREQQAIEKKQAINKHRRLFDVLSEESSRYNRGREPFSVCILDIDHFKHVIARMFLHILIS